MCRFAGAARGADKLTFLAVEHDMGLVARLCDPVEVMAQGTALVQGSFAEIFQDVRVQDADLGKLA